MKVLVDTSIWSLAFRHKKQCERVQKLIELISSSMVVMIGPIRQELLSGISNKDTFLQLKTKLQAFNDFAITSHDYETAAQFYNTCRKHGIQGSHIDFLICAVAHNNNLLIFTADKDFDSFAKWLPVRFLR